MNIQDEFLKSFEYLGDGVYVGFDGFTVWLHANHHANPTDKIALEPSVMEALIDYYRKKYSDV